MQVYTDVYLILVRNVMTKPTRCGCSWL